MANIFSAGPSNNVTKVKESPKCDWDHATSDGETSTADEYIGCSSKGWCHNEGSY